MSNVLLNTYRQNYDNIKERNDANKKTDLNELLEKVSLLKVKKDVIEKDVDKLITDIKSTISRSETPLRNRPNNKKTQPQTQTLNPEIKQIETYEQNLIEPSTDTDAELQNYSFDGLWNATRALISVWLMTVKHDTTKTNASDKISKFSSFETQTAMKTYEEKNGKIPEKTDSDLREYFQKCVSKTCKSKDSETELQLNIENLEPKSMNLDKFFFNKFYSLFERLTKTLDSIHKIEGFEKTIDRYKKLEMLGLAINNNSEDFQSLKARIHSKIHSSTKTKVLLAAAVIVGILSVTAVSVFNFFGNNDQTGQMVGGGGKITEAQKQKIKEIINKMQISDDEKNKLFKKMDSEDLSEILSGIDHQELVGAIDKVTEKADIKDPDVISKIDEVKTQILSNEDVLNKSFIQDMLSEDKLKGGKKRTKRNKKSNKRNKRNNKSNRKRRA